MANPKEYAYYVVGSTVGIVERDVVFDNDPNSKDYGPGVEKNAWKSPLSSVTDGLKFEYTYSPIYNIHRNINTGNVSSNIWHVNGWFVLDGYLAFVRAIGGGVSTWNTNSATSGSLGDTGGQTLDYIVVAGSSRWNGLHRIQTAGGAYGTLLGGILKTYTKADTIGPYYTAADFDLADTETVFDGGGNPSAISIGDAGFAVGDYVWMSGHTSATVNNGVFTVSAVTPHNTASSSTLTFDTRYYMPSRNTTTPETELSAAAAFTADTDGDAHLVTIAKIEHEVSKIYTDVSVLNDEDDTIDLQPYLSKALVYFVKGKTAEDMRDIEGKEYYMKEFRKMVEKHESSKVKTGRFISSGAHAIR